MVHLYLLAYALFFLPVGVFGNQYNLWHRRNVNSQPIWVYLLATLMFSLMTMSGAMVLGRAIALWP